jgi:hypothetical protein
VADDAAFWRPPACLGEHLGERPRPLRQQPGVIGAEQVGGVRPEHRGAARLQHHHARARLQLGPQCPDGPPQRFARHAELSGGDPGEAAAHRPGRHLYGESGVPQHRHGGLADLGMEAVGERVRPQDDSSGCLPWTRARLPGTTPAVPPGEPLPGEGRQVPVLVDATGLLDQPGQQRRLPGRVD